MDPKSESLLNELIEPQLDALMEEDSFYQRLATPLKSAMLWKQQHREELKEYLKFKGVNQRITNALDLIAYTMPSFTPAADYAKVKQELDNGAEHFRRFVNSIEPTDRPILFQEMLGLSDDTILSIYAFGRNLVEQGNTKDAMPVFALLTILAPHVESYWVAEGVSMQDLGLHDQAIAAFSAAKFLNPEDPSPIQYSIESYHVLQDGIKEQEEKELLQTVMSNI